MTMNMNTRNDVRDVRAVREREQAIRDANDNSVWWIIVALALIALVSYGVYAVALRPAQYEASNKIMMEQAQQPPTVTSPRTLADQPADQPTTAPTVNPAPSTGPNNQSD